MMVWAVLYTADQGAKAEWTDVVRSPRESRELAIRSLLKLARA